MTPLSWEFMSDVFNQSLSHSLQLMGLPSFQGEWFAWFDNYVYGNQTAVELIAAIRPLKSRNATELVAEIPRLRQQYSWVVDLPAAWGRDLDRFLIEIGRLSAVSFEDLDEQTIWNTVVDLMRVAADYFRPNIAISMTQSFLHRLLHALVEMVVGREQSLTTLDGLLSGIETKTSLVNAELHELALMVRQSPELCNSLQLDGGRSVWENKIYERFPEFAKRFRKLLIDHGHREIDIDYREPTWSQQPAVVLDSIALVLQGDSTTSPAHLARQQRIRFVQTELQFLSILPDELRFFFRELIRLTRSYTSLDDFEHYQTTRVNPIARQAAIALGKRLRDRSILDEPDDIFFADKNALEQLIVSNFTSGVESFKQAIQSAKKSYQDAWRRTPSWNFDESYECDSTTDSLSGMPGSPGQATGECFLVRSPADFSRFPKGAILVARTTNPAWTPLFYSASGLITESGGALSHGAVTAREMRLPAVMSVRGVMTSLTDGQVVRVDGTRGILTFVQ
jgi:pyruvate,water dikinase